MSPTTQKISAPSAAAEPQAGGAHMPVWLIMAALLIFFVGGIYFDANGGWFSPQVYAPYHSVEEVQMFQPPGGDDWKRLGQIKYELVCALCHGTDGMGKAGQAPPFKGSEWVLTENPGRLIRIPLGGLTGPIKVHGELFVGTTSSMPAMGSGMSDEELAAVLSYMRNSWGNKASVIKPEEVKAIRAAAAPHTQPWTADELMKVP